MTDFRETYERVAKVVGADLDESTVCYKHISDRYMVSVSKHFRGRVHVTLVDTTQPLFSDERVVAEESIKVGASDRVIINRYNKLMGKVQ